MDVQRIYQDADYERACESHVRYDKAIADAAERLTCADLLKRLGYPELDPTPDSVRKAANKRTKAAARSARLAVLREVCREFALTYPSAPEGALTRLLEQLREQRDQANKRAAATERRALCNAQDAHNERKRAEAAEASICADLLEYLDEMGAEPTPQSVRDAFERASDRRGARQLCNAFALTQVDDSVEAIAQLRERFEGHAQAVAAAHKQRDRANKQTKTSICADLLKRLPVRGGFDHTPDGVVAAVQLKIADLRRRAEASQKVAQTWFEEAAALRKQLDEAERIKRRAIEDMRAALHQRNEVAAELAMLRRAYAQCDLERIED